MIAPSREVAAEFESHDTEHLSGKQRPELNSGSFPSGNWQPVERVQFRQESSKTGARITRASASSNAGDS